MHSYVTIATEFDKFKLLCPAFIGIVIAVFDVTYSFGNPLDSGPKTIKSPSLNSISVYFYQF